MNFFFLFSLPAADYCPTDQSQENRNLWPCARGGVFQRLEKFIRKPPIRPLQSTVSSNFQHSRIEELSQCFPFDGGIPFSMLCWELKIPQWTTAGMQTFLVAFT